MINKGVYNDIIKESAAIKLTSISFKNHVMFILGKDPGVVQLVLMCAPGATLCTSVLKLGPSSGISVIKFLSEDFLSSF